MHLDTVEDRIVEGVVSKLFEREVGTQLSIQPREDVQVERRRNAQRIVVSAVEHQRVFLQVDTNQQAAVWSADLGDPRQETLGVLRNEVTDR